MDFNGRAIRIVAGLHGNELAPVRALTARNIDFLPGNPRALERNTRLIDKDLNASFGIETEGYESGRAKELLALISLDEVVVDFHTTSAKSPPFVILTDRAMIPLAERTGLKHAVLMTHNIKEGHALINFRDGISIEISGYDTQESFDITLSVIEYLESGKHSSLELYEVFEKLVEPGEYRNFEQCDDGSFPILVGEDSYDFVGLKARKII